MSGHFPSFGAQVAIDRHLDEQERQEREFYATHTACAWPGCDEWPSIATAFRATSEDGTNFYCSGEHWDAHVCGLGLLDA